jgi:hypothetical protein
MTRRTAAAKQEQPDLRGGTPAAFGAAPAKKPKAETTARAKQKAAPVAGPAVKKGDLTVVKNNPANTLAVLTRAMSGKDGHNLQIVAALHKEMLAEQARLDYIEAKRLMKRALPTINKDGRIEYKDKGDGRGKPKPVLFASYENLHDCCRDPLFEHGFDMTHAAQPGVPGMINVVTTLIHTSGHSEQSVLPMPHDASGGKSPAQGWASAFSFGKRINMIGLLDIVTRAPVDRDVDGNAVKRRKSGEPQTIDGDVVVESGDGNVGVATVALCSEEQLAQVRDAIAGCGVSDKAFCQHFGIAKVSQLPAARLRDALDACRNHAEKQRGAR